MLNRTTGVSRSRFCLACLSLLVVVALGAFSIPSCSEEDDDMPTYPYSWPRNQLTVTEGKQTSTYALCGPVVFDDFRKGSATIYLEFKANKDLCGVMSLSGDPVAALVLNIDGSEGSPAVVERCSATVKKHCYSFTRLTLAELTFAGAINQSEYTDNELHGGIVYILDNKSGNPDAYGIEFAVDLSFRKGVTAKGRFKVSSEETVVSAQ